jgi:hypothetical protein
MVVPGFNVVPCEQKLTTFATEKIKSLFTLHQPPFSSTAHKLENGVVTYSTPHSCKARPFFNPLILNFLGSGIAAVDARTGPIGHAPSKPFE